MWIWIPLLSKHLSPCTCSLSSDLSPGKHTCPAGGILCRQVGVSADLQEAEQKGLETGHYPFSSLSQECWQEFRPIGPWWLNLPLPVIGILFSDTALSGNTYNILTSPSVSFQQYLLSSRVSCPGRSGGTSLWRPYSPCASCPGFRRLIYSWILRWNIVHFMMTNKNAKS